MGKGLLLVCFAGLPGEFVTGRRREHFVSEGEVACSLSRGFCAVAPALAIYCAGFAQW